MRSNRRGYIPAGQELRAPQEAQQQRVIVQERAVVKAGWTWAEWSFATIVLVLVALLIVIVIATQISNRQRINSIKSDVDDLPDDLFNRLEPLIEQQTEDINDHTTAVGEDILTNVTRQFNLTNINIISVNDSVKSVNKSVNQLDSKIDAIAEEQQKQSQQLEDIQQELEEIQEELENLGAQGVPVSRQQCILDGPIDFNGQGGDLVLVSSGLTLAVNGIENGVLYNRDEGEFEFFNLGGEDGNNTVIVTMQINVLVSNIQKTVQYRLTASTSPDCNDELCQSGFASINGRYESDDDQGGCHNTNTAHPFGCQILWLELKKDIKARVGDTYYFFMSATNQSDDDDDDGLGQISNEDDYYSDACSRASFSFQSTTPPFLPTNNP